MSKTFFRSWQFWMLVGFGVITIGALGVGTVVYGALVEQWDSPAFRSVARALHVPAASVNGKWVLYTTYLEHVDAEQKFLEGASAKSMNLPPQPTAKRKSDALDRAIRIELLEQVARQEKLQVTPLDVDRAYQTLLDQAPGTATREEVKQFLQDQFGWDEEHFKNYVVRSAIIEDEMNTRKERETKEKYVFTKELNDRLKSSEVVRYLTIKN